MSKHSSNGNGDPKVVIACTTNEQRRWVYFRAEKEPPRTSDLPLWINRAFLDWQEANPTKRVRSSLGIVSNGMTVAIHAWYDEDPAAD
jgi:hypothetical protein